MNKDEKIKELEQRIQKQAEIITTLENMLEKMEKLLNEEVFKD